MFWIKNYWEIFGEMCFFWGVISTNFANFWKILNITPIEKKNS
jgi:hypothetical protein